jgi:hypothetical protein
MKKLGLFLIALLISVNAYAFLPGEQPGPRGGLHLNLGVVNSSDYPTLDSAIGDIGTSNGTLLITTPLPIIHSLTVPSNVRLEIKAGGSIPRSIDADGAITLTINGPISAAPVTIFSGSNLSVVVNLTTTPVVYAAWGTFTTTGTAPVNLNQIVQFGTTTITSGSAILAFSGTGAYSTSISYQLFSTTYGTGGTTSVTQTSGTAAKITSGGADGTKINWFAIGN